MNWKRNLLTLAVSSALVACSGGGGGGSSTGSSATVGGTVAKGIITNAVVRILAADGTELGTTTTDANGDYSFELPSSYDGGLLRIEVVGTGGGTMKCDVVGGCDHDGDPSTDVIPFGGAVNLTESFKLESLVPGMTGSTVSAPVTALTDMAAKLAIHNVGSGALNADAIAVARSQVANLFGLTENDLDAKPLDITNPAVIATATVEQLRSALYSAAVLGAVMQNSPNDIGDALEAFSTAYANAGGQLTLNDGQEGSDDPNVISFDDVLEAAVAVANEGTISGAVGSLGGSLVTQISNNLASAANASVGSTTTSEPSPTAGSENLQQARAMIADLRDLSYALGNMQSGGVSSEIQALVSGPEAFRTNLQIAGDATGPEVKYLLQGLGMAAAAMAEAAGVYADELGAGVEVITTPVPTSMGLSVEVTPSVDNPLNVTFVVVAEDHPVEGHPVDIDLTFGLNLTGLMELMDAIDTSFGTDSEGNQVVTTTAGGTVALNASLVGSVGNSAALLSLPASLARPNSEETYASQVVVSVSGSATDTEQLMGNGRESSADITVSEIGLSLAVRLEQQGVDTPASFEGAVGTSIQNLLFQNADSESYEETTEGEGEQATTTYSGTYEESSTLSLGTGGIQFGGTFAQGGNSFDAQFNLNLSSNGFVATDSYSESWSDTYDANWNWLDGSWNSQYDSDTTGFITGSAVLSMDLTLEGLAYSPAGVQLTVARDSETTGSVDLRVDMGASKHVVLAVELQEAADTSEDDLELTSATLTNQDGVTITLQNPNTNPSGVITKGSGSDLEELGTVSEGLGGSLLFRLRDGLETRIETL